MTFGLSAAAIAGIAVAGGAVAGAAISSNGAKKAAQTQADAAGNAADMQRGQWDITQAKLNPYLQLGSSAIQPYLNSLGYNTSKNEDGTFNFNSADQNNPLMQRFGFDQFNAPTAQQAEQTPGYQFTRDQGLQATQNSAAARGLGTSGAAMKGAASYATGLADSTYNDVYNRALSAYNANYSTASGAFQTNYNSAANNANRLQGLVSSGQNAAATNGTLGAANSAAMGNLLTGSANAQAAGMVGSANAMSGAMNGMGNSAMMYGLMQNNAAKTPGAGAQPYGNLNPSSSDPQI